MDKTGPRFASVDDTFAYADAPVICPAPSCSIVVCPVVAFAATPDIAAVVSYPTDMMPLVAVADAYSTFTVMVDDNVPAFGVADTPLI